MVGFTDIFGGTLTYPSQLSYLPLTLTASVVLAWPLEQNPGGGNIAADIIDVNATSPGLSIQFSDATQIGPGYAALVVNVGSNSFSVLDNSGNTLATINSGQAWQLYLRSTLVPAGTWGVFQFGAGVSSANAGALAGAGLKAITTTLNEQMLLNIQSSNYTVLPTDRATVIEWTGGVGTITGPSPAVVGAGWFCAIKNNGSGLATFTPPSGTIDGQASKNFDLQQSGWVVCDGVNFITLGFGQPVTSIFNFIAISLAGVSGNFTLTGSQLNAISYRFSGAMAGATTVVVPATIQQYWVDNETTGGTLSFGTAGQVTPVSIPATQKNILYCDGANVQAAVTGTVVFPITPPQGGTGLTTVVLGDTLYASALNTIARLAGITSTSGLFLSQTGTGAASAAPKWTNYISSSLVSTIATGTFDGSTPVAAVLAGSPGTNATFQLHAGFNIWWNGSNWVTGTDGTSNGGALITGTYGPGLLSFYTIVSTGAASQTISNASLLSTYLRGSISGTGNWVLNAPVSGTLLTLANLSGQDALDINVNQAAGAGWAINASGGSTADIRGYNVTNTTAGANAGVFGWVINNDSNRSFLAGKTSSAFSGSRFTGTPTGEICFIQAGGNIPISFVLGSAPVEAFRITSGNTVLTSTLPTGALGATALGLNMAAAAGTQIGLAWTQAGQAQWQIFNVQSSGLFNIWNATDGSVMTFNVGGSIKVPLVGTTASAANAFLDNANSNNLLRSTSSIRYKKDVRSISAEEAEEIILKLRLVSYHSKAEADDPNRTYYGLISEEVAEVSDSLVNFDAGGDPDGVQYDRVSVMMLPVLQKFLESRRGS